MNSAVNEKGKLVRTALINLVAANIHQLQSDFEKLTPYQRLKIVERVVGKVNSRSLETLFSETAQIQLVIQSEGEMPLIE